MNILDPQGPIAAADKTILINSIAIMLAIVVPTIVAIFAFAWYFRASNTRAFYWPDWEYSGRLELVVWSIPALTIILLGGVAWIGSHQLDPAKPVAGTGQGVTIQVVSLDWKWLFIYPDQRIATVNTLTVPVGAPLHFQLTSASVMNVFFIPQLGSMIYTMNGMVTRLELRADEVGNLSGPVGAFQRRRLSRHAVRRPRRLADRISRAGPPAPCASDHVLNADSYKKRAAEAVGAEGQAGLSARRSPNCSTTIATQKIPPGPGPQEAANIGGRQCSVS